MEYIPLCKLFYSDKEHYEEIYYSRFCSDYTLYLDFTIHGNPAFVVLVPSFYRKITELYRTDKKIKDLCNKLPGKALEQFARRCLVDEIILTNDIEGVYSSRREIHDVLSELEEKSKGHRFYGLVQKYLILQSESDLSFQTCEDIRSLYNDLVYNEIKEDDPDNLPDGKIFRKDSASVKNATQKVIHQGVTPESQIIFCMNKALSILNDSEMDCMFRVSIFHYLFGYIHPFYDGNGRTSRFISSYLLAKEFEPILGYRISHSIKENISDYYKAFKICNDRHNRGDLTPFVIMFFDVVLNSMHQLMEALEKRFLALENYGEMIKLLPKGTDEKYRMLYDILIQASLFSEEGISKQEIANVLKISKQTVDNRIKDPAVSVFTVKQRVKTQNFYRLNLELLDQLK